MKKDMWWVQSLMKYWLLYFIKHKNDMHAPAVLHKLVIHCLILKIKI